MTLRSTTSDLRDLGKTAADLASSSGIGLTEAVVRTIGHTKLSVEQVRRVVEAANHASFQKAAQVSHDVNFDSGPADPSVVLEALKTASVAPAVVYSTSGYDLPPSVTKVAGGSAEPQARAAIREVILTKEKLANMHEECVAAGEAAKSTLLEHFRKLHKQASRALHMGATPDDLLGAWMSVNADMAKATAERMGLVMTGTKTASRVNPDHPIVTVFNALVSSAQEVQSYDAARINIETELHKVASWLTQKRAS